MLLTPSAGTWVIPSSSSGPAGRELATGAAPTGLTGQQEGASRTSSPPRGMKGAPRPEPPKSLRPPKRARTSSRGTCRPPCPSPAPCRALAPRTRPPSGLRPESLAIRLPPRADQKKKSIGASGVPLFFVKSPLAPRSRDFQGRVPVPAPRPLVGPYATKAQR